MAKKELTSEQEQQKEIWLQEIKANEAIQQYFSTFCANSIEDFIKHYLEEKTRWMEYAEICLKMMNDEDVEWVEEAFMHLENILQKKLFDLQCSWRAEQIKIEGIKLCCEFDYWGDDILNCPFVEPITKQELGLYIAYLEYPGRDLDEDNTPNDCDWQDYEELKKAERDDNDDSTRNFPEWYEFVNTRTGADALLLLPDIRGQKEEFYLNLFQKELRNKRKNEPAEHVDTDDRPYLWGHDKEVIEYFVQTFETNEIKEAFRSDKWNYRNSYKKGDLDFYIDTLLSAEEEIPIEANTNWIEGIRMATEKYKRRKIVEALPEAWEQYKMNKEMGIGFLKDRRESDRWLIDFHTNRILTARRLNGEPQDLDF